MGRKRIKSEMWRDLTDKEISVLGVPLEEMHQQQVQRETNRSYNGILLQWCISVYLQPYARRRAWDGIGQLPVIHKSSRTTF